MLVKHHVTLGAAASILSIPAWHLNAGVFFLVSVLLDADHYLDFLYRNGLRDFSVKKAVKFHLALHQIAKDKSQGLLASNVFHTVEFLATLAILAALTQSTPAWAALLGAVLHFGADLLYEYREGVFFTRALSVVEYAVRWNRMKRQGLNPEMPYRRALQQISAEVKRGRA